MTGPIRPQISLSPNDQTLDAAGFATPGDLRRSESGVAGSPCPRVHLVEGSDAGLSTETQSLLRLRLRSAALVILAGSAAFYLWGWITPRPLQDDMFLVEQR